MINDDYGYKLGFGAQLCSLAFFGPMKDSKLFIPLYAIPIYIYIYMCVYIYISMYPV